MTTEEKTLSEKVIMISPKEIIFLKEDVAEAVKKLKHRCTGMTHCNDFQRLIDKIFGRVDQVGPKDNHSQPCTRTNPQGKSGTDFVNKTKPEDNHAQPGQDVGRSSQLPKGTDNSLNPGAHAICECGVSESLHSLPLTDCKKFKLTQDNHSPHTRNDIKAMDEDNHALCEWAHCRKHRMRMEKLKPAQKDVYIERAAKLDAEGIKAICGTDEEYSNYVKETIKEKKSCRKVDLTKEDLEWCSSELEHYFDTGETIDKPCKCHKGFGKRPECEVGK